MPDLEPAEALDLMMPTKTPEQGSDDEPFSENESSEEEKVDFEVESGGGGV